MDETRNDAPLNGEAPQPAKPQPLRRVGSFTLGVCLIAAGIFFLLAYFVPGFDWKLTLKIAPAAGLILLGGEVLYSSEAKTLRDVNAGNGYLSLTVELFGGYDSVQAFAQDCRSVTDAVQQCSAQPDELRITWSPENDPGQSLASGSLQNVEQYTLELEGIAQLDWTADQMAKQTEVQYLLDEENEETAESEAFSEESAELSE